MTGTWTLTDESEFILNEPYKTNLAEANHAVALAWHEAIYNYLAEQTGYNMEYVCEAFVKKVMQ